MQQPALLLEHYRVPLDECASGDGSTPWRRHPQQLGRGAHGEVWLEQNAIEGKSRAVKTVRKLASRQSVNAEVQALVNLSQRRYRPFFGEFMGFHEDANTLFFFKEYFALGDLRRHMPRYSGLPEPGIQSIVRQILHGVKAMQDQDYIHRDLKPENIFVVSRHPWRVKIGDFGVAKKLSADSMSIKVGTEQYMAPEMLTFITDDDESPGNHSDVIDIWSTGIICYELLAGERPFPTHAKLKDYCDGRYTIESTLELNSVSNEGVEFVHELLQPKPMHRPSAAVALTDPWLHHPPPKRSSSYTLPDRTSSCASSPPERPLPQVPRLRSLSKPLSPRFHDEGYYTTSQYTETSDQEDILDFAVDLASNIAPPPVRTPSRRVAHERDLSLVQAIQEDDKVTQPTLPSPTPSVSKKSESLRPISVISSGSNKSASAEIRDIISQRLANGQWKVNDVIVSCNFLRWDLHRIVGYMITSAEPLVLSELLHKNYVEEMPMLVFNAIKPWLEEQLGASKLVKTLSTNAKRYAQNIRDSILASIDLYAAQPEYYMLSLPRTAEVVDITQIHVRGDEIQVPSELIISTIKDHWRHYNLEYIDGFMHNEKVTLKGRLRVRAVVFDEKAKHQFLQDRVVRKLGPDFEYFTFDGFRDFAERTGKKPGRNEDVKPARRWRFGR